MPLAGFPPATLGSNPQPVHRHHLTHHLNRVQFAYFPFATVIPLALKSSKNETPPSSKATRIAVRLLRVGTRLPDSKSRTVETPTLAFFASAS